MNGNAQGFPFISVHFRLNQCRLTKTQVPGQKVEQPVVNAA